MGRDSVASTNEDGRQIGACQTDETALQVLASRRDIHVRDFTIVFIDHAQALHDVTLFAQLRDEAHAFCDVVAETPEVDEITARAQRRRLLEQDGFMPKLSKPKGKGGPRNADSVDADFHEDSALGFTDRASAGHPLAHHERRRSFGNLASGPPASFSGSVVSLKPSSSTSRPSMSERSASYVSRPMVPRR